MRICTGIANSTASPPVQRWPIRSGSGRDFPASSCSSSVTRPVQALKGVFSKLGAVRSLAKIFSGSARTTPKRLCVYTAVFAGYDSIVEHVQQTVDCDFVLFTDDG